MRDQTFTSLAIDQIAFIFAVTVAGTLTMFAVLAVVRALQRRRAARFHARAMRTLETTSLPPAPLPPMRITSRGRRRSRSSGR